MNKDTYNPCYCCDTYHEHDDDSPNGDNFGLPKQTDRNKLCCFCDKENMMFTNNIHRLDIYKKQIYKEQQTE